MSQNEAHTKAGFDGETVNMFACSSVLLNLRELDDKSLEQAFSRFYSAWCAFPTAAPLVKELLTWLGFLTLQEMGRNLLQYQHPSFFPLSFYFFYFFKHNETFRCFTLALLFCSAWVARFKSF